MSRTRKHKYTKSKAVSKQCRCNGGCPYCESNRFHKYNKQPKLDELLKEA